VTSLSTTPQTVLATEHLYAGYGEVVVVRDVDLSVGAGEIVALLGPNGSGKSTLLLTMAGELPPVSGRVLAWGEESDEPLYRRARRGLGFVPEERSVLMGMSVRDNLLLGRGGVDGALAIFPELEALLDRRAGLLSGGEQQILTLGRALAAEPKAMLVDELSLGLAPLIVERLLAVLRRAADERGIAILLVEQQVRRALHVSDRWYLMRGGSMVASGDASVAPEELERIFLADSDRST
jgi:branched-chain amino acid transport system ATP-binding protein